MNGAVFLGVDVDASRIEKRLKSGYCDKIAWSLDEALLLVKDAREYQQPLSVGLVGNCAEVLPELIKRGVVPDILTDQTSAHDALNGYVPHGMTLEGALALRGKDPEEYVERSMIPWLYVEAMLALKKSGAVTFDYGNNIRAQAEKAGVKNAFDIPGFVPEHIRPMSCEWCGLFRGLRGWKTRRLDRLAPEMFPKNETPARWMKLAGKDSLKTCPPDSASFRTASGPSWIGRTSWSRKATQGPDRHRTGSSRFRLKRAPIARLKMRDGRYKISTAAAQG
jgi:urocanate hydratase